MIGWLLAWLLEPFYRWMNRYLQAAVDEVASDWVTP